MVCDVPVYFRDEEASLRAVPPTPYQVDAVLHTQNPWYTDKKENQILVIYKEIQNGAVAKSYMTNGLLIYMGKYLSISSYIMKPFVIYDFATAPL